MAPIHFKDVTWEVVEAVALLLDAVASRHESRDVSHPDRTTGIEWTLSADSLDDLAAKLRMAPIAPGKAKVAAPPPHLTWDSLKDWDGGSARMLAWYLNEFAATPPEVVEMWRLPEHIVPFAPWAGAPPVACDENGNVVRWCEIRNTWKVEPFNWRSEVDVINADVPALGLTEADIDTLREAGVISVSEEGMAFIPKEDESGCHVGHEIVPIAAITPGGQP